MERENDVQLVRRTLLGDDDAFSTLVQKHQKGIHAIVWRRIGDFHIAEEITQDAFLQAYKKLSTLRNPNQFAGWLCVIANRMCFKWLKKHKLPTQSLEDTPMEVIEEVSYTHHESQQRESEANERRYEFVRKLLNKLPESERTVVTLYYLGEMTTKEIGKYLGVSINTITSRLQRGRKRLQEQKEETLVQETLGSIQISADFTERIMRQVADINPIPSPTPKPLTPWIAFGTTIFLIVLLLGASNHYFTRFQRPYSFEAISEPTIEIIDTAIILDTDIKPDERNQVEQDVPSDKGVSAASDTTEVLKAPQRLNQKRIFTKEQQQQNIEICTQNLLAIGKAIQAYQKENEDFPGWLSDIYPKYLADSNVLICPTDTAKGKALYALNIDPKMPVSYGYQFHSAYRENRSQMRLMYGDVIPLVRCRHHENEDFECLNLSFSCNNIYTSTATWEDTPEDMYDTAEAAINVLEEILKQYPDDIYNLHPKLERLYAKVEKERSKNGLIQELIGKSVPDFSAIDLDGNPISLQDYRGKVVLLNFWAVWFDPSTAEMTNVKKIYNAYKDQDFDIIGISLDTEKAKLRRYINENDIQWRQIFDSASGEDAIVRRYGIRRIPALWLVDREGKLINRNARGIDLERLIAEALKDASMNE